MPFLQPVGYGGPQNAAVFSVICSLLWILRMFIAAHLVFSVTFTLFVCVALHTTLYDKTLQHTLFQGTDFTKPL